MEKLEWCGYPTVYKFWRYVYSFWHNVRTWQTHTYNAWQHKPRLHSIARQKLHSVTACACLVMLHWTRWHVVSIWRFSDATLSTFRHFSNVTFVIFCLLEWNRARVQKKSCWSPKLMCHMQVKRMLWWALVWNEVLNLVFRPTNQPTASIIMKSQITLSLSLVLCL